MCKTLKHIISLMIAGLCINNLPAQTVTLSAEINWKEKDIYFLNYDKADVPFLKFTYKNNTADLIYFYNSLKNKFNFSDYLGFRYISGFLVFTESTPYEELMYLFPPFPRWSDNEYVVTTVENLEYRDYLTLFLYKKGETNPDYEYIEKSREHHILDLLTAVLRMQLALDMDGTNLQYEHFHHPDKVASEEKISEYYKSQRYLDANEKKLIELSKRTIYDNCVFLKPYESFSFEYDLTPFFLLKGSYNFIIQPQIPDFVMLRGKNTFPKVHNGYKLFTGQLNSVDIRLTIPPFEQARVPPSRYINIFQNGK